MLSDNPKIKHAFITHRLTNLAFANHKQMWLLSQADKFDHG